MLRTAWGAPHECAVLAHEELSESLADCLPEHAHGVSAAGEGGLAADVLCEQAEHDCALRAALLSYVKRKLYAADEQAQAAGAAVAARLLRGQGLLLPEQVDAIWSWAFQSLRPAHTLHRTFAAALSFVTSAVDTLPQKKAADLYTGCLKPWLCALHLPWGHDSHVDEPWCAAAHLRWAATQPSEHAAAVAKQLPALLACFLAVERKVDPARWRRHATCAVDATPSLSSWEAIRGAETGLQPAWCAMHAQSACSAQVATLRERLNCDAAATADTLVALLNAMQRCSSTHDALKSAVLAASPSTDSRPVQVFAAACQAAPSVDTAFSAELFVRCYRSSLPDSAMETAASFLVQYLSSESSQQDGRPQCSAKALVHVVHSGALRAALELATSYTASQLLVSQCLHAVVLVMRTARTTDGCDAARDAVAYVENVEVQLLASFERASDLTTVVIGAALFHEVVPEPGAQVRVRVAQICAERAAAPPPGDERAVGAARSACFPELRPKRLHSALGLRGVLMRFALNDSSQSTALQILNGALVGFEHHYACGNLPDAGEVLPLQWRDIDAATDLASVLKTLVAEVEVILCRALNAGIAADSAQLFCRVCELAHRDETTRRSLLVAATRTLTKLSGTPTLRLVPHDVAQQILGSASALRGPDDDPRIDLKLASEFSAACLQLARASGLSSHAADDTGPVGASVAQLGCETAAAAPLYAATAEAVEEFEPSDYSGASDNESGERVYFMQSVG